MITEILIVAGTLVNVVIAIFSIKAFLALENRVSFLEKNSITDSDRDEDLQSSDDPATALMNGFQKVREDEQNHLKLLEMSRKLQGKPPVIMTHNSFGDRGFDSDGDLIPNNLTEEEQNVLKMFYDKNV